MFWFAFPSFHLLSKGKKRRDMGKISGDRRMPKKSSGRETEGGCFITGGLSCLTIMNTLMIPWIRANGRDGRGDVWTRRCAKVVLVCLYLLYYENIEESISNEWNRKRTWSLVIESRVVKEEVIPGTIHRVGKMESMRDRTLHNFHSPMERSRINPRRSIIGFDDGRIFQLIDMFRTTTTLFIWNSKKDIQWRPFNIIW